VDHCDPRAAVIAFAARSILALPASSIAQVAVGVVIAGVSGAYPLRIPGRKTSITGAETFIFLVLMMNGPAAAALAAAAEAAAGSFRTSKRWTSRLGSPAMAGLAMYACGTLYMFAWNSCPAHRRTVTDDATAAALPDRAGVLRCGHVADGVAHHAEAEPAAAAVEILPRHSWMALVNLASAALAALLFAGYDTLGAGVFLAALPVIAAVMVTHRVYLRHIEDNKLAQQQRVLVAEREAAEAARHLAELQKSESRFQKAFATRRSHGARDAPACRPAGEPGTERDPGAPGRQAVRLGLRRIRPSR